MNLPLFDSNVRDESGRLFNFNGFPLDYELEINSIPNTYSVFCERVDDCVDIWSCFNDESLPHGLDFECRKSVKSQPL